MGDPASGATLTYAYNPMSQVSQVSYGGTGTSTRSLGYDSLHRLTSDTLTHGSTTLASISYGYNPGGYLTSKTTTGLAGSSANTYGYDRAGRLTSWNNGTTTTSYAYDGAGNRTQAGAVTYTYDARDQLTSDGTSTYSYTADGDLTTVTGPSGTVTSTSDAYGQQGTQGTQASTYDALGRDTALTAGSTVTALAYEGTSGLLAGDGASSYTYTPGGTLAGTAPAAAPGTGVLDLTDHHTDLIAQFTPAGTTLAGSRTYGPWGTALAGTLTGSLGYQSQYTSPLTGQVNMGARWYNPATGSFGNKDTVTNKPVPDSASASPFGYAADNPLGITDPSGHRPIDDAGNTDKGWLKTQVKNAVAAAKKTAKTVAHTAKVNKAVTKIPQNCAGGGDDTWGRPMCQRAVYLASGGQLDSRGRPTGKGADPAVAQEATRIVQDQHNAATKAVKKPAAPGSGPAEPATTTMALAGCGLAAWKQGCAYGKYQDPGHASGTARDFWGGVGSFFVSTAEMTCYLPNMNQLCDTARANGLLPSQLYQKQVIDRYHINQSSELYFDGTFIPNFALSFIPVGAIGEAGSIASRTDRTISELARACLTKNSFTPGTLVLLATGKTAPIAALKPGTMILASDTRTGKDQPEAVTAVEVNHDTDLYNLKVKTSHGVQVIHTTASHLFWDPYQHQWIASNKLSKGEHLKTPDGSLAVADGGTTPKVHDGWMWDLTVPGNNDHDFYVIPAQADHGRTRHTYNAVTSDTPVLVHNTDPACGTVSIFKAPWKGMTDKLLKDGFTPADFPGSGNGFPDGNAYFGMHDEGKTIALDYAGRGGYDGRVIEVRIPQAAFDQHFARYVTSYDGRPGAQIAIPNTMFDVLNQYPRVEAGP